jgi:hypothetical protein
MIVAFVEADEGVHNTLAADPEWESLPHPLSNKPVSARVAAALAAHGVATSANTFDVAEAISRAHPSLIRASVRLARYLSLVTHHFHPC